MKKACFLHPSGKESSVWTVTAMKKFLEVFYLQNIYAISSKEIRIILIFTSVFRAKKDCPLWEDNKSDTFHLSNKLKSSLFFWCPEGATSQLDTFSEDCNLFTKDCRTVTSLLLYFNWNLPLDWHLQASFHLPVTPQSQQGSSFKSFFSSNLLTQTPNCTIWRAQCKCAIGLFNGQPPSLSHPISRALSLFDTE